MEVNRVTQGVAGVQITDQEEDSGGFIVPNTSFSGPSVDLQWALVGRFLTDRFIRLQEMSHIMAMNWCPGRGVYIQEISPQLFLFQFAHEADIRRVTDGGPWSYDNHPLLFKRVKN